MRALRTSLYVLGARFIDFKSAVRYAANKIGSDMEGIRKTALITGCSSGLGRQMALLLKEKGWHVYATARKEHDVNALKKIGFDSFVLDLSQSDSIESAVRRFTREGNHGLGVIIHNAAFYQIGAIEDLSRDVIRNQFETNVFGVIELTSRLIPLFRNQGYGKVVFISSLHSKFAFPFLGAYAASKYAIEAFSEALRRELRHAGIDVMNIYTGQFKSRLTENAIKIFRDKVDIEHSIHRYIYENMLQSMHKASCSATEDKTIFIARRVVDALESRRPRARIVVNPEDRIRYLAHKLLPDTIQDWLLSLRWKHIYKRVRNKSEEI